MNEKAKQEKSAGAVIYYFENNEPKFLLLKYTRYWGFAKGGIEENESEEQTALREIMEETGLNNINLVPGFKFEQRYLYKVEGEFRSKHAVFFLARVSREEAENVKISEEHEEFKFLNLENALKLCRIKQNKDMLEKAYEFIRNYERQKRLF